MRLILSTSRAEPLVFPRQRRFWGHATASAQLNGGEQIEPLGVSSAAISSEGRVLQVDEHDMTDVTIVVCTRNRVDALHRCLSSISETKLQCPTAKAELVVVDNGPSDDTRDLVSTWLRSAALPVRFVEERRPGLGAARNAGVRNARGRLI